MTPNRPIGVAICVAALAAGSFLSPSTASAQCDQVDAPGCICFIDTGVWNPGGASHLPGTHYIQDVALETLGVQESCSCPGTLACTWDPPGTAVFENGGKPYYQMVRGNIFEDRAFYDAALMVDLETMRFPSREAWCSETVAFWHRESGTPYLNGYYTDWHEHWRISNVADLRTWYETEEAVGGQGRWIEATEISYHDFEPGMNAPVPGAYIAIAEYDDMANAYPNMRWSHSIIVDEMTVHRDGHGNVFQVEIDILEGNSGDQVTDLGHWDDLLTVTPNGSGWVSQWPGPDGVMGTADDIRRKVYGVGIDLDQFGQPYYDPVRLHEENHLEILHAAAPSSVTATDDDWDGYSSFLPHLIQYVQFLRQEGGPKLLWGQSQGNPVPIPDGDPLNALSIPAGFSGEMLINFLAPHPLPMEGLELTWEAGSLPLGYTVEFLNEIQQSTIAQVPDLSNYPPPEGLPVQVPAVLGDPLANVHSVRLFFPAGSVRDDAILSQVSIRFEQAPWDDAPGESLDVQRPVFVDVKPGSCPNSVNPKSKGVVPVAILGTFDLDVAYINPATVVAAGNVAPLRWSYEDVGTPYIGGAGGCHDLEGDGIVDLTLKFDARELADALDIAAHGGQAIPLMLHGTLLGDGGETVFLGEDWLRVLKKK